MWEPLGNFLPQAIRRTGAERSINAAMVVEASGPLILQIVPTLRQADFRVVSYRDGCLTLGTTGASAAAELRIHQTAIIEALNDSLTGKSILRLRFIPLIDPDEE